MITSPKATHKMMSIRQKTIKSNKIEEKEKEKENKDKNGNDLNMYCPTNATLANPLTKPLTKANM
jgi:hypothetical protein